MGVVIAYICDSCPLAFEVGEYSYWELTGSCTKVVCGRCGTMHRIESSHGEVRVFSLPGPIRSLPWVTRKSGWNDGTEVEDYEWPFTEEDWELAPPDITAKVAREQACIRCHAEKCLVFLEDLHPATIGGCPVCRGPLASVYQDTVN